jgi:hypothetical protein
MPGRRANTNPAHTDGKPGLRSVSVADNLRRQEATMKEDLSPDHIREASEALIRVVTSPQYLAVAAEINALPLPERERATLELMTVDGLRSRGLQVPDGLRISPRWFEPPAAGRNADNAEVLAHGAAELGTCVSVGEIVCVSQGT